MYDVMLCYHNICQIRKPLYPTGSLFPPRAHQKVGMARDEANPQTINTDLVCLESMVRFSSPMKAPIEE